MKEGKELIEETKRCVKCWIDRVWCFNTIHFPIQCPRCLNSEEGISLETMECQNCGYIIPKLFYPPRVDDLLILFQEIRRKEAVKRAKKRLKEINYY